LPVFPIGNQHIGEPKDPVAQECSHRRGDGQSPSRFPRGSSGDDLKHQKRKAANNSPEKYGEPVGPGNHKPAPEDNQGGGESRYQDPHEIGSGPYAESHRKTECKRGPEVFPRMVDCEASAGQPKPGHYCSDCIIIEDDHVHERRIHCDRYGREGGGADAEELGDLSG
jgi:hypothetical protein